jgi:hypothetical protein
MPISIHGSEYLTVAERLHSFRQKHQDWGVLTELSVDGDMVRVRASITDETGRTLATGYAEEDRRLGNINKTSAVENAETSAVGRALAFLGYGGTYIRSAEEMQNADYQAEVLNHIEYMGLVREHWVTINVVKDLLAVDNIDGAREAFKELEPDVQMKLWKAPTKGGAFDTIERKKLKEGK